MDKAVFAAVARGMTRELRAVFKGHTVVYRNGWPSGPDGHALNVRESYTYLEEHRVVVLDEGRNARLVITPAEHGIVVQSHPDRWYKLKVSIVFPYEDPDALERVVEYARRTVAKRYSPAETPR